MNEIQLTAEAEWYRQCFDYCVSEIEDQLRDCRLRLLDIFDPDKDAEAYDEIERGYEDAMDALSKILGIPVVV